MNMAEDIAVNGGQPVAVFSLGMNRQQFVPRFLCMHRNIHPRTVATCMVSIIVRLADLDIFTPLKFVRRDLSCSCSDGNALQSECPADRICPTLFYLLGRCPA
jgi:hypothetical protein